MSGSEKFVLLGKVVGVHGVRGELKLEDERGKREKQTPHRMVSTGVIRHPAFFRS